MRTYEIELAAAKRNEGGVRQRPSEPRRRKAEGGRRRHHHGLARFHMPRQQRADAIEIRVARGEHANLPAALRQHFLDGALEWRRPRPHRAAN
jgi:hypothetical protein